MEKAGPKSGARALSRLALRFWSATALADAAMATPMWLAMVVGPVLIGVDLGLVSSSAFCLISGPVPDFGFLWGIPARFLRVAAGSAILFGGALLAAAAIMLVPWGRPGPSERARNRAETKAMLLAPLAGLAPAILWFPLGVLGAIADPANSINSGKPAWTTLLVWRAAGTPLWIPIFGLIAINLMVNAARVLNRRFVPPDVCRGCGYSHAGLLSDRCPECGRAVDATSAAQACP